MRKKLKAGDYSKVSSIALGLDASWGRLASDRVPPPTVERSDAEHHRVLECGDRKVSVCRIVNPQWTGLTKKVETVGSRQLALLGVPSSPADVEPECVLPLWVVVISLQWGRQHQVLVKSGKAVARHRKEIVEDTAGW